MYNYYRKIQCFDIDIFLLRIGYLLYLYRQYSCATVYCPIYFRPNKIGKYCLLIDLFVYLYTM